MKLKHFFAVFFIITLVISASIAQQPGTRTKPFVPDNCTRCHQAWADRFDYFRGWDRYGYAYELTPSSITWDPWYSNDVLNTFKKYYGTDWWESPENHPWGEIADINAQSMGIIPQGFPSVPSKLEDIKGEVIIVERGRSIQDAVNSANQGATVFVRAGIYNETIVMRDGVNLIGENPHTTVIDSRNRGHCLEAANNSIVAGFTFTGTGINYAQNVFNSGIYVSGCDNTSIISGNIFRDNGLFGVFVEGNLDQRQQNRLYRTVGMKAIETVDRPYIDYPTPVIAGNTFYRIGQRGIFYVHGGGEAFNNVFVGNIKAMGMEFNSRPFVHHNVFFFNNVPLAINRSQPLICNNIFLGNQWGQRMLRGANPVIFGNVTKDSPFFRDFDESGFPIPYNTVPGTNERELDPMFVSPMSGDFSFQSASPLKDEIHGFSALGIMRDKGLPQPPPVVCRDSWGREVLAMSEDIEELISNVDKENEKIRYLTASYDISYTSWLNVRTDRRGDPVSSRLSRNPVVKVDYHVPLWIMDGENRIKEYKETITIGRRTTSDYGLIMFDGDRLSVGAGRFASIYNTEPDDLFIGERPFRENPGGFYRDYDQYVKGAIGATGTFYHGFLRIMGGLIFPEKVVVDGYECIVVRYPHIGKDQYFLFYLDPETGYRPRKMEQFFNELLCRTVDSYVWKEFDGGIWLPLAARITDYVTEGTDTGRIAAVLELEVDEQSIRVNPN